jgi:hypothetical protein
LLPSSSSPSPSVSPSSSLSSSIVVAVVVSIVVVSCLRRGGAAMAAQRWAEKVVAQRWRWRRSNGDGSTSYPSTATAPPPPCPTTIARPPSPRHLVRDLDLVVSLRPPSSVATAATAVFLLSPHLPHCLIVVSIVPRREGAMRPLLSCRRECVSL